MPLLGPRLVVAGTHSGVGKTTVATGLLVALRGAGHRVAAAKVGPDFIDPGYHALASDRPPRNLDPWICGADATSALAAAPATGADVLVVEGVMGLFDGAADGTASSTADVARLLDAPVLLVVDAGAMAGRWRRWCTGSPRSIRGCGSAASCSTGWGSDGHAIQLREALEPLDIAVVGVLHRDDRLVWRDRHLGLVPVLEDPTAVVSTLDRLGTAIADGFDLDAVVALARSAPPGSPLVTCASRRAAHRCGSGWPPGRRSRSCTPTTLDALAAGGAEVVPFDPLVAPALPEHLDGLIVGGGFPEVHACALADNRPLLDDVRAGASAQDS